MRLVSLIGAKELKKLPELNTVYKLKTIAIAEINDCTYIIFIKSHGNIFGLFINNHDGVAVLYGEDFPNFTNLIKHIYLYEKDIYIYDEPEFPDEFNSNILFSRPSKITSSFHLCDDIMRNIITNRLEEIYDIRKYILNLSIGNSVITNIDVKKNGRKTILKSLTR